MSKHIYWKYFKYVMNHKKNVFIECMNMAKDYSGEEKRNLIIHAFTHDMSKFLPCEFIPYARYDFQNEENNTNKIKEDFEKAWKHHYLHNKHHWDYWIGKDIPLEYIRQMIADWRGMSRKFGGNAEEYYLKHYNEFKLTRKSRYYLECNLSDELFPSGQFTCECDPGYWMTVKENAEFCLKSEKQNNQESTWFRNECIPYYKNKYHFDLLEVLKAGDN